MEKKYRCKCKTGCRTKRCRCFKNNEPCGENCGCTNCRNPLNEVEDYKGKDRKPRTIAGRLLMLGCNVIVLAVMILSCGVGGIAIMHTSPLSVLTCRYVETTQVDCRLQERIAWVIPVREIPITHLKEAHVDHKTETRVDDDRESDTYGKEYIVDIYRVILISDSGEIDLKGTDEIGLSAKLTATRINDYLKTPTGKPLTVWGFGMMDHLVVTLVGGGFFILAILLFVGGIVELVVGIDTAKVKMSEFYQKIEQKMPWMEWIR